MLPAVFFFEAEAAGGCDLSALERTLDRWSRDEDFWIRRSAMLALLLPLRDGGGDWARFAGYADRLLEEKEFFIRKAICWVLRETSKAAAAAGRRLRRRARRSHLGRRPARGGSLHRPSGPRSLDDCLPIS